MGGKGDGASDAELERAVVRRVSRRLIPLMFAMCLFNFLDRGNIGIAALTMKHDLRMSDAVYGLGAGIFFLGYFAFEIPSNLILARVGARRWIARIAISWGIVACATMFVRSAASFYGLRFLLGLAEAGFYPGMILYLTYWIPSAHRARILGSFSAAIAFSGVVGAPLGGWLLGLHGTGGLRGWQWLFLVEGIPSVLLGITALWLLTDRPEDAGWLAPHARTWLSLRLRREQEAIAGHAPMTVGRALSDPRILLLAAIYCLTVVDAYGVNYFEPLMLKAASTWSSQTVAFCTALPALCMAAGVVAFGIHSDRVGERRLHVATSAGLGAVFVALAAVVHSPYALLFAFCGYEFAARGGLLAPFWAMATSCVGGTGAAGGIAFINAVGALGGFCGPTLMGRLKQSTHGYTTGLLILAAVLLLGGVLALFVHHDPSLDGRGSSAVLLDPVDAPA